MSYVFGKINNSGTIIESKLVEFTQNLDTASSGIQSIKINSGSLNNNYWQSLNVLFYTSGSPSYESENKFANPSSNLSIQSNNGQQFLTKYHGYPTSSLITIPSKYYGEKIKKGSFQFVDLNNQDLSGNNPTIIDDSFGNLYSTNAHHSQSGDTAASSSDNYVGNIFYDKGLVVITETGSWSGSVDYSDLATNFSLKFDSQNTITTHEYDIDLLPQDYNLTMNYSIRNVVSKSDGTTTDFSLGTSNIASPFTSSDFQPYITTINLYREGDYVQPVIQATLPKPIRKSDKINTRFKIKLDL
jgi:hypothetical protein